jgi:hypothetical protein
MVGVHFNRVPVVATGVVDSDFGRVGVYESRVSRNPELRKCDEFGTILSSLFDEIARLLDGSLNVKPMQKTRIRFMS